MAIVTVHASEKLPEVCVRCGEPADVWKTITFRQSDSGDTAMMMGLSFFLSCGHFMMWRTRTYQMQVGLPLCHAHRHYFGLKSAAVLLAFVPAIVGVAIAVSFKLPMVLLGAIVLAAVILAITNFAGIRELVVRPSMVKLTGVSEVFVEELERLRTPPDEPAGERNPFDFSGR
jgi:hypothetical protein